MTQSQDPRRSGGTGKRLRAPAIASLIAALLALALPAVLSGQAPGQGTSPSPGTTSPGTSLPAPQFNPAVAGGPAPDLDLLFTAQVAGWIEPCG